MPQARLEVWGYFLGLCRGIEISVYGHLLTLSVYIIDKIKICT